MHGSFIDVNEINLTIVGKTGMQKLILFLLRKKWMKFKNELPKGTQGIWRKSR
jgi:hypothetical protein